MPEYLNYQFKAIAPALRAPNMGSTHQTIYQRDAAGIEIVVPPLAEQHVIVEYLDCETARIDTLIEEQHRLIEMLRERRGAVADQLLNPPAVRQPLKRFVEEVTVGIVVNPSACMSKKGSPRSEASTCGPDTYPPANSSTYHWKAMRDTRNHAFMRVTW